MNPRFVFVLAQEAGDAGKELCPGSSLLGQGLAWCGWRCHWQHPALEECRNLISSFSETGFSGCANTKVLPAVLSRPSRVQQNPPQNPSAEANDSKVTLTLSCQHSPLCHRFPQVPGNRCMGRYSTGGFRTIAEDGCSMVGSQGVQPRMWHTERHSGMPPIESE